MDPTQSRPFYFRAEASAGQGLCEGPGTQNHEHRRTELSCGFPGFKGSQQRLRSLQSGPDTPTSPRTSSTGNELGVPIPTV